MCCRCSITRGKKVDGNKGLEIVLEKTEVLIIKGTRKREGIVFSIGWIEILPKKTVKYLGVHLDDKLIFNEHVKRTCKKASRQVVALIRILHIIKSSGYYGRRMLYRVVASVALYAAPLWEQVIKIDNCLQT